MIYNGGFGGLAPRPTELILKEVNFLLQLFSSQDFFSLQEVANTGNDETGTHVDMGRGPSAVTQKRKARDQSSGGLEQPIAAAGMSQLSCLRDLFSGHNFRTPPRSTGRETRRSPSPQPGTSDVKRQPAGNCKKKRTLHSEVSDGRTVRFAVPRRSNAELGVPERIKPGRLFFLTVDLPDVYNTVREDFVNNFDNLVSYCASVEESRSPGKVTSHLHAFLEFEEPQFC